jgi:hypothetical protein
MARDPQVVTREMEAFEDATDGLDHYVTRTELLIDEMRKVATDETADGIEDIIKDIQDNVIGELNGLRAKIELRANGVAA